MKSIRTAEKRTVRYSPQVDRGLSSAQVSQRVMDGLRNQSVDPPSKTVGQIVFTNVFTFFNLVFCVLAACILITGSYHNLLFMGVVILNTAIGIFQEIRAKRVLDRLTLLSTPSAVVVRDGAEQTLPVDQLVLDDIVRFSAGNQICADAVVRSGQVEVNESLLTGEADPILKNTGDTLLSGSFVVSGRCYAQLDKVGADSYAAQITAEAKKHRKVHSEMMRSLTRLVQVISILLIPFSLTLFFKQVHMMGMTVNDSIISTVASAVGMIPEGLYLLTSVALAVSVINLSRNRTLVHELYCIETLARVDVLCLDKTGTITEGAIRVRQVIPLPGHTEEELAPVISAYLRHSTDTNMTSQALRNRFLPRNGPDGAAAARPVPGSEAYTVEREIPFSSSRKWGAVTFAGKGTYLLGAPEPLLGAAYPQVRDQVEAYSSKGQRVLLFGACDQAPSGQAAAPSSPVHGLALLVLSDRIRPEAPATFAYFKEQGVAIKVISGDNPAAVSEIARQAGVEGAERYVDASSLATEKDLAEAAERYTVFGRVTPQQKRTLIRCLKSSGHTVAMTGDGVNDVLALKDADCSIAMASGSDAASHVSQLVLLDSNFASMPKIVGEGRRVINNIERSASLFLVKNIFSFLVSFVLLFAVLPYPFMPIQLTLISALTIGIPSFVLALEPTYRRIKGHFIENVLLRALPGGLTDACCILGLMITGPLVGLNTDQISMCCTILAGLTGLLVMVLTCYPFNWIRGALCIVMGLAFAGAVVALYLLDLAVSPGLYGWLLTGGFALLMPLIMWGFTCLFRWIKRVFFRHLA